MYPPRPDRGQSGSCSSTGHSERVSLLLRIEHTGQLSTLPAAVAAITSSFLTNLTTPTIPSSFYRILSEQPESATRHNPRDRLCGTSVAGHGTKIYTLAIRGSLSIRSNEPNGFSTRAPGPRLPATLANHVERRTREQIYMYISIYCISPRTTCPVNGEHRPDRRATPRRLPVSV